MQIGEHVMEDYRATQLSLKAHPMGLLRGEMTELGYGTSAQLASLVKDQRAGSRASAAAGLRAQEPRPRRRSRS